MKLKPPPWPAHIQREIDIDNGWAKRTWDEQKKAFGLFAYAQQLEAGLTLEEVKIIREKVLTYFEQGGVSYSKLEPWMAKHYLEELQTFQNYSI